MNTIIFYYVDVFTEILQVTETKPIWVTGASGDHLWKSIENFTENIPATKNYKHAEHNDKYCFDCS